MPSLYLGRLQWSTSTSCCNDRPYQHECYCLSVHSTLAAANQAAKNSYDIDDAAEEDWVEAEDGWLSWEDLDGTRIQTDATGAIRIIQVDGLDETVVWVEKHRVRGTPG